MIDVKLKDSVSTILDKLAKSDGGLAPVITAYADKVFSHIRAGASRHNKTGKLLNSLQKVSLTNGFEIHHSGLIPDYASILNTGHRAFEIVPKGKKALRWMNGGGVFFAKVVHIPALQADPYFQRGIDESVAELPSIVASTWHPFN